MPELAVTPKVADRPHSLTLLVAMTALAVSIGSFWQACESRRIAEIASAASVNVVSARLLSPLAAGDFIRVSLTVTNFGKATARNVAAAFEYRFEPLGGIWNMSSSGSGENILNMGPGFSREVIVQSPIRFSGDPRDMLGPRGGRIAGINRKSFVALGTTTFTDELSGRTNIEGWCFTLLVQTEIDLQKTELIRCPS